MLIELTLRCNENCPHCLVSATPEQSHMNMNVLGHAINFALFSKAKVIVITGGEITTDPDFFKKISYIIRKIRGHKTGIILESNGTWIRQKGLHQRFDNVSDEETAANKEITKQLSNLLMSSNQVLSMQISTHKKFYKHYDDIIAANEQNLFQKLLGRKVTVVHDWQGVGTNLHYLGRAQKILDPETLKGNPSCSNILTRAKQIDKIISMQRLTPTPYRWVSLIEAMETSMKLCTPMISVHGDIHIGESPFCQRIGNVIELRSLRYTDISNMLMQNLDNMKFCNKCKVAHNVPELIREKLNL